MKLFSAVGGFLKKMFSNTNWTHTASATLTMTAPLVETLVTVFAGAAAGSATTNVIHEIQTDFGVVTTTLNQAQSGTLTGSQLSLVTSSLNAIKSNLGNLEAAAHISDPATLEKVNVTVSAVTAEITAIIGILPAATPAAA